MTEADIRADIAIDVVIWCNAYAVTLYEQNEVAAAAAINLMGKHLARQIMEDRCSKPYSPPSSP